MAGSLCRPYRSFGSFTGGSRNYPFSQRSIFLRTGQTAGKIQQARRIRRNDRERWKPHSYGIESNADKCGYPHYHPGSTIPSLALADGKAPARVIDASKDNDRCRASRSDGDGCCTIGKGFSPRFSCDASAIYRVARCMTSDRKGFACTNMIAA